MSSSSPQVLYATRLFTIVGPAFPQQIPDPLFATTVLFVIGADSVSALTIAIPPPQEIAALAATTLSSILGVQIPKLTGSPPMFRSVAKIPPPPTRRPLVTRFAAFSSTALFTIQGRATFEESVTQTPIPPPKPPVVLRRMAFPRISGDDPTTAIPPPPLPPRLT